ncbi:uncharacterized protein AB675_5161 [Cyphellophora attinorum]|uniref:Uncharacterized protein n=1 Tax=Cyphellophora attinorum TaxID=1664694 RepID=A0A0N1H3M0_9EURO|nr:uncharacterized protein AB675_5161 [Phialophora attinorum]KPI39513.1 hypothetical protein AB675_5161 [Phialophora attinorum]
MATATATATSAVHTTLRYDSPSTPSVYYPGTASAFTINRESVPVTIQNAREHDSSEFTLDTTGFELHSHHTRAEFPDDKEVVKQAYYPEVVDLLKAKTGATQVIPVDHLIRRHLYAPVAAWAKDALATTDKDPSTIPNPTGQRPPGRFVHVDQSYDGAVGWLRDNIASADQAEKLMKTRWAIINVWRPLTKGKVTRDPLGLCDGRSVKEGELREVVAKTAAFQDVGRGGEIKVWMVLAPQAGAAANGDSNGDGAVNGHANGHGEVEGGHKWWYYEGMTKDEVLFIKCFDSKTDGRCRRAPHSAFDDPRYESEETPRESIEVRCLVFWEDQEA